MARKVFLVAGEVSGDILGAWFVCLQRQQGIHAEYTALGGAHLAQQGVALYRNFADISVVGIAEIVRHLRHILRVLRNVAAHISAHGYDEVVVIDFPGFNMRLIRMLKKRNPRVRITYLSPPQMWVWGAWRIKAIRAYTDRVVVLYPFEQAWYKSRGVNAEWIASPVVSALDAQCNKQLLTVPQSKRSYRIVVLPGSRRQEITSLMPLYARILKRVVESHPGVTISFIVAPHLSQSSIVDALQPFHPEKWNATIEYVSDAQTSLVVRASAICALTKPGTNTLELALLGVPTVVVYQTSWITYWIARMVVNVSSMTLPNLLCGKEIFPEYIQEKDIPTQASRKLIELLDQYRNHHDQYMQHVANVTSVRTVLTQKSS